MAKCIRRLGDGGRTGGIIVAMIVVMVVVIIENRSEDKLWLISSSSVDCVLVGGCVLYLL